MDLDLILFYAELQEIIKNVLQFSRECSILKKSEVGMIKKP